MTITLVCWSSYLSRIITDWHETLNELSFQITIQVHMHKSLFFVWSLIVSWTFSQAFCNETTLISSLRVSVKLSACILITVKNNQINIIKQCESQKAFFRLIMKLYEAMLIKLIRTIRLTQNFISENSLNQIVFFVN